MAGEVPELCSPVRAGVGARRGRAAASLVAAAALLACCVVLTVHSGGKAAVLDEAGALALAESYFPTSAPQQELSQVVQKEAKSAGE